MSKRLQVVLDDSEYRELARTARRRGLTISQWVREAIRSMKRQEPVVDVGPKLAAVREASSHSYPTGDIDQMLAEIKKGYLGDRK